MRWPLRRILLSVAFGLTGVGTALLGAALPATLHAWRLSDSRGGLLLLTAWGGSTSGALLVAGVSGNSAATGLLLSAAALLALSARSPHALIGLYLLYGIGLGMTMTAISMLRSREVKADEADVELNRLNLIWAVGACMAPAVAFQSLQLLSVALIFKAMCVAFAALGFALLAVNAVRDRSREGESEVCAPQRMQAWAPARLCLFASAAVGLESAIGSWLTTYTQRITQGAGMAASANAAFWVGLLLSRAAHSIHSARWLHTRAARVGHLMLVGIATAALIAFPKGTVVPVAGLLSGIGLGPLYPYVLSVALPRYRSNAVFVLAGVGASLVPWLTGLISSASNSLRIGLLAPAATFLLLLAAARSMREELAE